MPEQDIISVAVPVPLRQTFDFIVPDDAGPLCVGARVKVPFGNRKLIGVITELKASSDVPVLRLKQASEILDKQSVFDPVLWRTLQWLASYYLAPIGEVLESALPALMRQGSGVAPMPTKHWELTDEGRSFPLDDLQRAPLQLAIIKRFMHSSRLVASDFKQESAGWRQAVTALVEKGWVREHTDHPVLPMRSLESGSQIALTTEQVSAATVILDAIRAHSFSCQLLHGVTGSGKTEVYFAAMDEVLRQGQQVLLMVPEIGLTPQLLNRLEARFEQPVVTMHSALNSTERHLAWWHARVGSARIVVGTRSSIFSSFATLGLIIVDEEHDASFKQQDGVRYQARDVAIYRAKQHGIPIVLGSATPSLETYANARKGRYTTIRLDERATDATLPRIELMDLHRQPTSDGLSPAMLEAIRTTLAQDKQVMLFLNRRGYAPVIYCNDCKKTVKCHRCDSNLTLHQRANKMRCHHCGYEGLRLQTCQHCQSKNLVEVGEGTQRVEDALEVRFPGARLLRIDRDSTRRKGELAESLERARLGQVDIILGTQLITKGHDFPNVGMVGILEADQGLHSTDFRSTEGLFQQILQVAGRAGRRDEVGYVFIQTHFPEHPLFEYVIKHDFDGFAETMLEEREAAGFPPFGFFALLRAESTHQAKALQFLRTTKLALNPQPGVRVMDAVPAPMERRAGRYRAQLLLCAEQRPALNATLHQWLAFIAKDTEAKKRAASVRWSLDIDPHDLY